MRMESFPVGEPGLGFEEPPEAQPKSLADVTSETVDMLAALWNIERQIVLGNPTLPQWDTTPSAIKSVAIYLSRLEAALPRFERQLPDHKPNMPEFAGCVASSYHAIALKVCRKRLSWLMQLVTWEDHLRVLTPAAKKRIDAAVQAAKPKAKTGTRMTAIGQELRSAETDAERAARFAEIIASRIDGVAAHAPQLGGDLRNLIERVRYECELATAETPPPTPRPDGPFGTDGFRHKGVDYRGLTGKAFGLVNYLWSASDRTAEFDELADPVWDDHAKSITTDRVGGQRKVANDFFGKCNLPFSVTVDGVNRRVELLERKSLAGE